MKRDTVVFLEVWDVELFHDVAIAEFDGLPGVRDQGLLESAVMQPRVPYYQSLAELAAVYAHGIVKNHPFVDGNKRAALIAASVFLGANGFDLYLQYEDAWIEHIERLAAGELSRDDLVVLLTEAMGGDPVWLDPDP